MSFTAESHDSSPVHPGFLNERYSQICWHPTRSAGSNAPLAWWALSWTTLVSAITSFSVLDSMRMGATSPLPEACILLYGITQSEFGQVDALFFSTCCCAGRISIWPCLLSSDILLNSRDRGCRNSALTFFSSLARHILLLLLEATDWDLLKLLNWHLDITTNRPSNFIHLFISIWKVFIYCIVLVTHKFVLEPQIINSWYPLVFNF